MSLGGQTVFSLTSGLVDWFAAGNNVAGAWTQVTASAPTSVSALLLYRLAQNTGPMLVDIGVGAAGSEVVVAERLFLQGVDGSVSSQTLRVPITVPAGVRVAIRAYDITPGSSAIWVTAYFERNGSMVPFAGSRVISRAASGYEGTTVTASSLYSWSAAVQVVASVELPVKGLAFAVWGPRNAQAFSGWVRACTSDGHPLSPPFMVNSGGTSLSDLLSFPFSVFVPCEIAAGRPIHIQINPTRYYEGTQPQRSFLLYTVH